MLYTIDISISHFSNQITTRASIPKRVIAARTVEHAARIQTMGFKTSCAETISVSKKLALSVQYPFIKYMGW